MYIRCEVHLIFLRYVELTSANFVQARSRQMKAKKCINCGWAYCESDRNPTWLRCTIFQAKVLISVHIGCPKLNSQFSLTSKIVVRSLQFTSVEFWAESSGWEYVSPRKTRTWESPWVNCKSVPQKGRFCLGETISAVLQIAKKWAPDENSENTKTPETVFSSLQWTMSEGNGFFRTQQDSSVVTLCLSAAVAATVVLGYVAHLQTASLHLASSATAVRSSQTIPMLRSSANSVIQHRCASKQLFYFRAANPGHQWKCPWRRLLDSKR